MKAQSGRISIAQLFLQPRRQMVVSDQRHAPAAVPSGRMPGAHCTEGWLGPTVSLDGCGKSRPNWESVPDRPIRSTEREYLSFYGSRLKTSSMCVCVCVNVHIYIYISHITGLNLLQCLQRCRIS
jgi:hypothetical protein